MMAATKRTENLGKTDGEQDWSTIPMAHSPQGFAELAYPWQAAKVHALKAQRIVTAKAQGRVAKKAVRAAEPVVELRQNLTALADKFGSDKGSSKHRYTELYHMLFHPYRDKPITFLEMGLFIGGPEHGKSADRKTDDLPSIRMWLEFFPKAMIHGLDVSDFSWFNHDRFTFHRCDMDERSNIAAARAVMPEFDIIIDDASHVSHHQQNAFLELFPRLRSGGLYIIEDLRWQPETNEKPGITKTADLFRSFSEARQFVHVDPATETAFNAFKAEISGCFMFQVGYDKRRRDQVTVIHKA
jgi:hypothetical protein